MKRFSLVTEMLGGPQAETAKARRSKQGVNIDHLNLLSQLYLQGQGSSICARQRTR